MDIAALYELYRQYPSVHTDTRKITPGTIFFALRGPSFNGNDFARNALEKGAVFAIVDDPALAGIDGCLYVPDTLTALQQLALFHRRQFDIPFIAITGSNGKTTTKELVSAVLRTRFATYTTAGNLNNHIGVPLTILGIRPDAEIAVVEMGANHLGEIAGYCEIARPTHAIITNCGKAHLEGFGSEAGVRRAKGELYDFIRANGGVIFRNTDLDYLEEMAAGIATQITYGSGDARYTGSASQQDVFLQIELSAPVLLHIDTHLVGAYNFPNVMAAVATGMHFGVSAEQVRSALGSYLPDNSRSQWLQQGSNRVILDAYNANPTSMQAAILNFSRLELDHKILWIGAMKEMGAASVKEHEELVHLIRQYPWQDVILVGEEFRGVESGFRHFDDSVAAAVYIREHRPEQAAILIKGSRGSQMEKMLEAL